MSMPQKSSITFSAGQKPASDDNQNTTVVVVAPDVPIYSFHGDLRFGASQISPSEGTFFSSPAFLQTDSLADTRNPTIPTSATVRPRLTPGVPERDPRLKTRQLWEGAVTEIHDGGFMAVLSDKTNPGNPDELGAFEFDNAEISAADSELIRPGSTFYWVIGSETTLGGQLTSVSRLQFRRAAAWTQRRLDRAADRARSLRASFQEEV
jgi:hypothetical protein